MKTSVKIKLKHLTHKIKQAIMYEKNHDEKNGKIEDLTYLLETIDNKLKTNKCSTTEEEEITSTYNHHMEEYFRLKDYI